MVGFLARITTRTIAIVDSYAVVTGRHRSKFRELLAYVIDKDRSVHVFMPAEPFPSETVHFGFGGLDNEPRPYLSRQSFKLVLDFG